MLSDAGQLALTFIRLILHFIKLTLDVRLSFIHLSFLLCLASLIPMPSLYAFLYTSFQFIALSLRPWLCLDTFPPLSHFSSTTSLFSSPFSSVLPLLLSFLPQFGKDLFSQTLSKTITTPPRRPLISPFSPPPSIHLPIYPSIDCHYSWTSVIPLLVQLRFPFSSHHSALLACGLTSVFLPVFRVSYLINYQICSSMLISKNEVLILEQDEYLLKSIHYHFLSTQNTWLQHVTQFHAH